MRLMAQSGPTYPSGTRGAERVKLHRWVRFAWAGRSCRGVAYDISTKGARIIWDEETQVPGTFQPLKAGEPLDLHWELGEGQEVEMAAQVVRLTDDGFAVEFCEFGADIERALDDVVSGAKDSDPRSE
jgi:hypothetical protein